MPIRNIAIIAHVDHGKTTLVDALLKQGGAFAAHEETGELMMDSNDQERERGITIYAKNTAINIGGSRVNIVDTPGHADFGSEVERVLRAIDGVLLLVDAQEGPMPQTKFVLKKSLELGLKPIVVVNKIDKPAARPHEVLDEVFDLFGQLGANDEQLDFPHIFAIAREGVAKMKLEDASKDLSPLFDLINNHVKDAAGDDTGPLKMQPFQLAYDSYVGRIGIGRIYSGTASVGQNVVVKSPDGKSRNGRISKIERAEGLRTVEVKQASMGDIVRIAGIPDINVGETLVSAAEVEPLPAIAIDPPTISMMFMVNTSPFAGKEGKLLTTRHIKERLDREAQTNVGLLVEPVAGTDSYKVSGRGELHLSVLIEQMRREGFELQLSRPEVICREGPNGKEEPMEQVIVDVPEENAGTVIEMLSRRKGQMSDMRTHEGHSRLEYVMPTRGLLGMRGDFIIQTRGEGILNHSFLRYEPWKGDIAAQERGRIISMVNGVATAYDLWSAQDRGVLMITPGTQIYEGMLLGTSSKGDDMSMNVTKGKKLTNMRASGSDEAVQLVPVQPMTLEQALEEITDDEFVEVTPISIRLRKKLLKEHERKKNR